MLDLQNEVSAGILSDYLKTKGKTHNYYKHYAPLETIQKICNTNSILLSDGSCWNDVLDSTHFSSVKGDKLFGFCFSFAKMESVAMWMLYGGLQQEAGMIDFRRSEINKILSVHTVEIGNMVGNTFNPCKKLQEQEFEIFVSDIVYYNKNSSNYSLTRSDEFASASFTQFDPIKYYAKVYPWHYEMECRLIVKVNRELAPNCTHAKIGFKDCGLDVNYLRKYVGPSNSKETPLGFAESGLKGQVGWKLK